MASVADLQTFLTSGEPVVSVRLTRVRGSSPREMGTEMFVTEETLFGTIGGGQLEHRAIDAARRPGGNANAHKWLQHVADRRERHAATGDTGCP